MKEITDDHPHGWGSHLLGTSPSVYSTYISDTSSHAEGPWCGAVSGVTTVGGKRYRNYVF